MSTGHLLGASPGPSIFPISILSEAGGTVVHSHVREEGQHTAQLLEGVIPVPTCAVDSLLLGRLGGSLRLR